MALLPGAVAELCEAAPTTVSLSTFAHALNVNFVDRAYVDAGVGLSTLEAFALLLQLMPILFGRMHALYRIQILFLGDMIAVLLS